ncbi:hypothetical protein L6452_20787 [Arctium lappa]|uniref:Uncharacterized protein n=1 Tax=Arctium lappa TaxID=4217 RepID=A0ACB9BBV4_ARCLA|nr:hypothetical protein L6452_20787 [Arctium lappa]
MDDEIEKDHRTEEKRAEAVIDHRRVQRFSEGLKRDYLPPSPSCKSLCDRCAGSSEFILSIELFFVFW